MLVEVVVGNMAAVLAAVLAGLVVEGLVDLALFSPVLE